MRSGDQENREDNNWRVPKHNLVAAIQVPLQAGRLQLAKHLPETAVLVNELQNFRLTINENAHDTCGGQAGSPDDLVLATALAVWFVSPA